MTIHICMLHGGEVTVSVKLTTDMSALKAFAQTKPLFTIILFIIANSEGLSEALFKVRNTPFFPIVFLNGVHDFLKVTTNISSSNFVGFTTKNLKAESLLDCASRCVFWEERSSYCNAFRCLLNNVNFKGGDA